ncbi:LysR substrate-binding domain-containing protein [Kitasatospora sp. NPDC057223]|uniref:LysR substrate-binding domain-containing protein n=1 Tax=Kitasatospora sp. NPDC057223 TaxID=3346055 RepID=UPI003639B8B9
MELRQLEYFVAVAEEQGFGRAAQRLHIVQAAVSQQIGRLERELGVRLFDRSTRQVRPTAAGERLLPEARAALAAAGRVREVAAGITAGTEGVLRLGTSRAFADRVYPALDALAETLPQLRVRLHRAGQAARLAAVRSGELDAALARTVRSAPGLELLPLWTEPLVVALPAGHPLAALAELRLADLAGLPLRLARRDSNPAFHDLITTALRDAGVEWLPGPEFTGLQETLLDLPGAAASWTVFYPVGALPQARRVAFRPLAGPAATTSLAVRPGPPSVAVRGLLDALATAGAGVVGAGLEAGR